MPIDTETLSEERQANLEPSSEAQAGLIINGLINHEAKALTLWALSEGEEYGKTALHRAFLDLQGNNPVPSGDLSNQAAYCKQSFLRAGLVDRLDGTNVYTLTPSGAKQGKAIAGLSLSLSESIAPKSLHNLFGSSKSPNKYSRLPVLSRFRIIDFLAGQGGNEWISKLGVDKKTDVDSATISVFIQDLAREGIVEYRELNSMTANARMSGQWKGLLHDFCKTTKAILEGDELAAQRGVDLGASIMHDPNRVKSLVERAYGSSSNYNKKDLKETDTEVLKAIEAGHFTITAITSYIKEVNARPLAPNTIRASAKRLVLDGKVISSKSSYKRSNRYTTVS